MCSRHEIGAGSSLFVPSPLHCAFASVMRVRAFFLNLVVRVCVSIGACAENGIIAVHWDANKRVVDAAHRSRSSLKATENYFKQDGIPRRTLC